MRSDCPIVFYGKIQPPLGVFMGRSDHPRWFNWQTANYFFVYQTEESSYHQFTEVGEFKDKIWTNQTYLTKSTIPWFPPYVSYLFYILFYYLWDTFSFISLYIIFSCNHENHLIKILSFVFSSSSSLSSSFHYKLSFPHSIFLQILSGSIYVNWSL